MVRCLCLTPVSTAGDRWKATHTLPMGLGSTNGTSHGSQPIYRDYSNSKKDPDGLGGGIAGDAGSWAHGRLS